MTPTKTNFLSYTQFKSFLENSFGAPDPIPIMKDYSTDFNATIGMLKETYKLLNERSIKGRFTRVIKKLEKKYSQQGVLRLRIQFRQYLNTVSTYSDHSIEFKSC